MEYVDGVPVHQTLKRDGKIDEKRCLQIALQMAKALSHAHKHGIVHRDVKPENIMITSAGVAKLCDLGLAKQTKGDADVTMDGTSVGTPNYISPEQARGEDKIDIRTDIYSLGATLYHMATGSTPFSGANPMVVMTKHVTEHPDPPKKRLASLSEGFNNLVMKMMQKRREDRYQDPDVLMTDIDRLIRGGDIAVAAAPKAASVIIRPATDHGSRRATSTARHEVLAAPKAGAPVMPLVIVGGVVALGVVAFLIFKGGGETTGPTKVDPSTTRTTTTAPPPPTADPAEKLRKELGEFRTWAEAHIIAPTSDRFTAPYAQLQKKIDQYKSESNFAALKAWQDEQGTFVERANKYVTEKVWEPIRQRVDEQLGSGRLAIALDKLSEFEEVYRYLGEGKVEKTRATLQLEDRLQRIEGSADQRWLEGKKEADRQFAEASSRDQAYTSLDTLVASLLPRQRQDVEGARRTYFEKEMAELVGTVPTQDRVKEAQARIAKLRTMHAGNDPAIAALDTYATQLKETFENFSKGALAQVNSLYATGFKPKFEEAMRQRDLVAIRRHLGTIYYGKETASLQTYLLPGSTDQALLKSFCDPARIQPVDTKKLIAQAEEGYKVASKPGQSEGARDLYFDLRTTLLVEDLIDQALEGAKLVSRDANRFKGYAAPLKDASTADPVRKANEGSALSVNLAASGKATITLSIAPRKEPSLADEDLVLLAQRAPTASGDTHFALKAFFLLQYAGKLPAAKAWYEKIPAEQKAGLERFSEGLKDTVSATAELEARTLYEEGHALWKKKDEAGAKRKFKECLDKYSNTTYMKAPIKLTSGDKSRIQILEDLFKLTAPGGSPRAAVKVKLTDLFGASDVKDLGGGKYDITYTFKEDKEVAAFQTVPGAFGGQINATRGPSGGVRLAGTGIWSCTVPMKGDVLAEMNFKVEDQKPLGFIVHGKGDRAGYAIVIHLVIPGAGQLDAVFKMPLDLGPQLLNSILAQGGKDLDLVKDVPSAARLERVKTKIKLTLNRGTIEADNAQFNDGRVGLLVPDTTVLIDKIRIVGEVDKAWIDSASKAAEAMSPQK